MLEIISTRKTATTWAAIKEALHSSAPEPNVGNWLHSGDMIPVTLKNGEEIMLDVARDETGKTFFVFHDCLAETHCMNKNGTTRGGWAGCDMREYVNSTIFDLLPDDLQAVIEPTHIKQVIDGKTYESDDKLFCLSFTQVFGNVWPRINAQEPDDTQLDIFKTERSRVKECGDKGTYWWWLRSADGTNGFRGVYTDGDGNYIGAYDSYGVALGFCL